MKENQKKMLCIELLCIFLLLALCIHVLCVLRWHKICSAQKVLFINFEGIQQMGRTVLARICFDDPQDLSGSTILAPIKYDDTSCSWACFFFTPPDPRPRRVRIWAARPRSRSWPCPRTCTCTPGTTRESRHLGLRTVQTALIGRPEMIAEGRNSRPFIVDSTVLVYYARSWMERRNHNDF